MSEFENTGIEKFFRSKLKRSRQNDEWASPPDFIFEKAIDQVNKEKKRKKRALFFWISLFGFVIILSAIIISQSKQLNDVKKSLDKLEGELFTNYAKKQNLNQEINTVTVTKASVNKNPQSIAAQDLIDTPNHNTPTVSSSNTESSRLQKQESQSTLNNHSSSNNGQQAFINPDNVNQTDSNNPNYYQKINLVNPVSEHLVKKENLSNKGFTPTDISNSLANLDRLSLQFISLKPLAHAALTIDYSKLSMNPQFADIVNNELNFKKGFSIAMNTGLNSATLLMDNMSSLNGISLTEYNKYYTGFQSEAALLYQISSRFSAGVHVNYSKINNQSTFEESSNLDFSNMQFINGKMEYSMPMDIFTPIGSHKLNSELIFDENLNSNNLITSQSDIFQSINSYGIGISARYSIIQKSRFSSFIGASFSHHLYNKTNSKFNTTIAMEDKVMKNFKTIPDEMYDDQKTYNSISAQVGLQYAISPKTKLLFQSSFGKSLNSLRQTNTQTAPNTYLQFINTGIGISYSLTKSN